MLTVMKRSCAAILGMVVILGVVIPASAQYPYERPPLTGGQKAGVIIGGGAAGAAIGAAIGGGRGAIIGGLIGAGGGTAYVAARDRQYGYYGNGYGYGYYGRPYYYGYARPYAYDRFRVERFRDDRFRGESFRSEGFRGGFRGGERFHERGGFRR